MCAAWTRLRKTVLIANFALVLVGYQVVSKVRGCSRMAKRLSESILYMTQGRTGKRRCEVRTDMKSARRSPNETN